MNRFALNAAALGALDGVADGVIVSTRDDAIGYVNAAARAMLQRSEDELIGRRLDGVFQLEADRSALQMLGVEPGEESPRFHPDARPMLLVSGERRLPVDLLSLDVGSGPAATRVLVLHDRSQLNDLRLSIAERARYDKLTGLFNRHEFDRCLANLVEDAEASGRTHALLYIDLDQFKVINDTCGHQAGDELLRQVGTQLRKVVQFGDIVSRLGGDEFGILLCSIESDEAVGVAKRVCQDIASIRFAWGSYSFAIGASVGVSVINSWTRHPDAALREADSACYAAKDKGRNRVHLYAENDRQLSKRHGEMRWLSRINKALDEDRLRIVQQRIAPIQPGIHRDMAEILVRIESPEGEQIAPGAFIPAAERYNLMPLVDRWVIRKVLEQLAGGNAEHDPIERYTINLSGLSLGDPDFLSYIVKEFERLSVDPRRICFEVTETAAVASYTRAVRFMSLLREIGCRFALDDFGSGMSSFGYLRELPVDYLKIDGMFVRNLEIDPFHRAIIKSIIDVDHAAGMQTIAEHVDSDGALDILRELGADYVQGFFIDRPVPFGANRAA